MNKKAVWFFLVFFALFSGLKLFFPQVAWAKSYSIDNVDINAQLHTDGSMDVIEKRNYMFDGDYTFAYQYIYKVPNQTKSPGRTTEYMLDNFKLC